MKANENKLYPFLTRDGSDKLIVVKAAYRGSVPFSIAQKLVQVIRDYDATNKFYPNVRAEAAFSVVFTHLERVIVNVMPFKKPEDSEAWLTRVMFNKLSNFCRDYVEKVREEHTELLKVGYDADTWDICEEDYAKYADFYEAQRASRWEVRRQSAIRELAEIWGFLTGYERKLFRAFLSAEGDMAEAARRLKMAHMTYRRHFERACLRARAIFTYERKTLNLRKRR